MCGVSADVPDSSVSFPLKLRLYAEYQYFSFCDQNLLIRDVRKKEFHSNVYVVMIKALCHNLTPIYKLTDG